MKAPRNLVEDAAEHEAATLHHLREGVGQGVNFDKLVEHVAGKIMRPAHGGMDADHAIELFGFLVDRPEAFVTQRQAQTDRGKHQADELELFYRAA
jgi:hypothetical protein